MLQQIEALTGRQARLKRQPAHRADVAATWADIGKAERLQGWRPQVPLGQGLAELVRWNEAEREWAREIATA